ncbi:hypothetical protein NLO413_0319 [Candidatus Neoehrlichia lotoris str. RAC413]|uniref:Uncharacterized protein n=1 Tax=Candidatus Neoehrlichia procyonis str. RAC413 TaxID=1359163 RepID=A0A0F3NML4_9RICK|nr:hypothetical protein NLO413_0319 [Candidatus Neoehrlichia lotoris str. RAC413]
MYIVAYKVSRLEISLNFLLAGNKFQTFNTIKLEHHTYSSFIKES